MKPSSFLMLAAAIALTFSGCSGGAEGKKPVYKVTGKVTMAGGPLIDAVVTFAPKEGQPVAYGRTNTQGEYSLTTYTANDGAALGNFAVTVTKFIPGATAAASGEPAHSADPYAVADSGHAAPKKGAAAAGSGNMVPPKYGSSMETPLSFKVEAKDNVYDIEIK